MNPIESHATSVYIRPCVFVRSAGDVATPEDIASLKRVQIEHEKLAAQLRSTYPQNLGRSAEKAATDQYITHPSPENLQKVYASGHDVNLVDSKLKAARRAVNQANAQLFAEVAQVVIKIKERVLEIAAARAVELEGIERASAESLSLEFIPSVTLYALKRFPFTFRASVPGGFISPRGVLDDLAPIIFGEA